MATNKDPHRPEKPNLLYFRERQNVSRHSNKHYWVLTDHSGIRIASSHTNFLDKHGAIRNCIDLFGKEIWAGYHHIPDSVDYQLVLDEGIRREQMRMIFDDI